MKNEVNRAVLRMVSLLARRWRGYEKKKICRARRYGPKDRERALKDFAQGGIYAICASHLEEALQANDKVSDRATP